MKASIRPLFRHYLAKKFILKNLRKGCRIFDVGCGRGDLDFWLCKKGYLLECFEFSELAIREFLNIKEFFRCENITLHQGDFMTSQIDSKTDAVISFEVLEHLDDEQDAISKMRNWLKPGGYLIISVPAHMSAWDKDDEIFGHKRRYEKKDLVKLMERNGFQIIEFASYGFPWLNILKIIREFMVGIHPPKFHDSRGTNYSETGTKHSGVGFFKSGIWAFLFNSVTFYPLFLISNLFNGSDWSEGYFLIAKKSI
jgi:SAM-dependent methyltransferase